MGLRSGNYLPEPARAAQPPQAVIRLPARLANREIPVVPNVVGAETLGAAPPSYTEQVEPEATGAPRNERDPECANDSGSERGSETDQGGSKLEPSVVVLQRDWELDGSVAAPRIEESQRLQTTLDPEIAETI